MEKIIDALSGILSNARKRGADEVDCEGCRKEILEAITSTPRQRIKQALQMDKFLVLTDSGFMDVGFLLSLRF